MPTPPLLDDMLLLVEVVEAGGLTAAAGALGLRKSTLSRRLSALEERLGTRLLERGARGTRLTEAGQRYHEEAARLVAEARRLHESVAAARAVPQGTLRVAAPTLLGELLAPALAELVARHPRLRVELALAGEHDVLLEDGADVALRTASLPDSALSARRVGRLRTGCFASPAYLTRRGAPRTADELAGHDAIVLAPAGSDEVWFFGEGAGARTVPVTGRLRVPSARAGQAAARAGAGIVRLPASLVADDVRAGLLVPVLAAATPPGVPVFAVFRGGRQLPPKVRAFLELLARPGAALPWDA